MKQTGLRMIGCVLLSIAITAGCGTDKAPTEGGETAKAATPEDTAAKRDAIMNGTELTLYHPTMTTAEFVTIYGKSIVQKYPNVKIKVLNTKDGKLEELITTGTNIDIIGGYTESFLTTMQNMRVTSDLTGYIKKYDYDLNLWDPSVRQFIEGYNGGKITAIPHTIQTMAMYYNKDLFSKFGVPFPTDRMTWDDVQEINRKLTRQDGGVMYWGYDTRNAPTIFSLNQLSLPLNDPKTNQAAFDTEPLKNYMRKLLDVVTSHGLGVFTGPGNQQDLFAKDMRLAMLSTLNTNFRSFSNPSLNWDIVKFPTLKELPGVGPQPQVPLYFVPNTSKHQEAAFLALAEITSPEGQRDLAKNGRVSILRDPAVQKEFGSLLPELAGKNVQGLIPDKYASSSPYSEYKSAAATEMGNAYTAVATGAKDLNTAVREAMEAANRTIRDMEATKK
ncbi:MAG: transporter substrate-binding protein [Paenibacillus sp.]|nr:transporter substrate-binding protein [Paenibacillus sp.]